MPRVDHRAIAVELFNHTWTLLDLADRTPGQDLEMVHAVLGHGVASLRHARAYVDFCSDEANESNVGAFDRAFAQEGLARASLAAGDATQAVACIEAGRVLAGSIEDEANRAWLMKNLEELAS